jgi:hypothetical protein
LETDGPAVADGVELPQHGRDVDAASVQWTNDLIPAAGRIGAVEGNEHEVRRDRLDDQGETAGVAGGEFVGEVERQADVGAVHLADDAEGVLRRGNEESFVWIQDDAHAVARGGLGEFADDGDGALVVGRLAGQGQPDVGPGGGQLRK